MEGLEKLQKQMDEMKNSHIEIIWNYLKTRKDLYDRFNNPEKNIKQMYDYIYGRAMKQKVGNVAMIADNIVFLWAVTYFIKSNEELGLNEKKNININSKPTEKNKVNEIEIKKEQEKEQISLFDVGGK